MSRKVICLLVAALFVCLAGCQSKSKKIVSYMEERYGTTFEYAGETNGMLGSPVFAAKLSCPDYPDMTVFATVAPVDGEGYYSDNFLAVAYHENARQAIEKTARIALDDCQVFLSEPDLTMSINEPEDYTLEDYLTDPLAFKAVWIVTRDDVDTAKFQELVQAFCQENISANVVLAVPSDPEDEVVMEKEELENFLANPGRVKTQINFEIENRELVREDWKTE